MPKLAFERTRQIRLSSLRVVIIVDHSAEYIAISLDDKSVQIFDWNGAFLHALQHDTNVWTLALRGHTLICGIVGGAVQSWNLISGLWEQRFEGHSSTVRCLTFIGPSTFVSASRDATLKVWSLDKSAQSCIATLSEHDSPVVNLASDPNSGLMASGDRNGTCRIWKPLEQSTSIATLPGHHGQIQCIAFLPGQSADQSDQDIKVATGGLDGKVKIWSALNGSLIVNLDGHKGQVTQLQTRAGGDEQGELVVTAGTDGTLETWRIGQAPCLAWSQEQAHRSGVSVMNVTAEHLATGGAGGRVRIWELRSGKLLQTLGDESYQAIYSVAFEREGEARFAVVSNSEERANLEIFSRVL